MRTQRYIRTIIAMLMLLLYGVGEVWAQVTSSDIIIQVMPSASAGTVSASVGELTGEEGNKYYPVTITVTPTVTPEPGYKIKKDLIVVEKMVKPNRSPRRRAPGIGTFELTGTPGWVTSGSENYTFKIPEEYDGAYVTATFVPDEATLITSLDEITDADGTYKLARDINASGFSGFSFATFTGTLDGDCHTIYGLDTPLFSSINGGTVKNLFFDNVSISGGTNVGAICREATGDSRIYNCGVLATGSTVETDKNGYTHITTYGSTISGSGSVGSLVGVLDGSSRVINCFSYANITGGNLVGGIVGENKVATTSSNLKTMVMNCMFYGDITGGASKAPIYNGQNIVNKDATGVGNYNYFRSEASWAKNNSNFINSHKPNCALMAEDRFLQRFEFFRHLLNSHLELAGWWATGTYSKSKMLKWVLEPSQIGTSTPYPVLKTPGKYSSVVNIDAENATTQAESNKGGLLGTLSVTIQNGSGAVYGAPTGADITTHSLTLNITDKDPAHFNFNYGKVQLPYYNDVGTKNYNGNRVVTGWKIVKINGSSTGTGTYVTGADVSYDASSNLVTPYNFADRNCTNKDLYSVSGRVFNQGAYWDVPEGVNSITIEPYWAKAVYLADPNADKVYNTAMTTGYDVPNVGGGIIYTNKSSYSIAGENQLVFTSMSEAIASSGSGPGLFQGVSGAGSHTVYDYAVVLVGNFHSYADLEAGASKPYTVTSVDLDGDNEPDYSYMLRFDKRNGLHPVRVDFINIPGLGMAQKSTGGTGTYNFGIMQPKGWFESTNTSLFRVTQFEYDRSDRVAAPLILQGGVIEQWVSGQSNGVNNQTTYFHVGGNVWFKEFHRGTHQDKTLQSKHPPVSVTGGDYDEFYLTGLYTANVNSYADNAECYINGGRFGTVCGAAMEGIGGTSNTGNITWLIQNADIKEFYAGGLNAAKPVTGDLTTTIVGSRVDIFCGGPKFGDMNTGKTVTTTATDCTFGTFFGAGYGGNSYSREAPRNHNNIINFPHNDTEGAGNDASWNAWLARFYKQNYNSTYGGVSTQFNYQFLPMSSNVDNVARIFVEYVKFSLATTHNVTSTLTGCTITGNFYGGGSLGKVDGNVTSTLTGCTVNGDVFGAGFSGSLPTVEVDDPAGFVDDAEPYYYDAFGTYRTGVKRPTTTYTWQHGNAISVDNANHILYTPEDLTTLGTVTGLATLNIEGTTTVRGNVYGGGESSDVADKTKTGENIAAVKVNIKGGTISHDVFGGGKGKTTVVNGKVEVNIGAKTGEAPGITYTGEGTVNGNVYGGSALGAVNATKGASYESDPTDITATAGNKTTAVNIYKGIVNGSVFGGGLGQTSPSSIAAQNYGNTFVTVENSNNAEALVKTAVYGGANVNGVMKADATVTILGGTVGTDPGVGGSIKNVVFGGGFGQPTLVNGNVKVNVGTKSGEPAVYAGNAIIWGNVYGGGALGNVNTSKPASELVFDATKKTEVYLYAGTINGNVYGGGLGKKEVAAKDAEGTPGDPGYKPAVAHEDGIEAYVGGDVFVLLDGAKLQYDDSETPLTGQIYGANNLNGTPKGHVKVWVKKTVNVDPVKDALKSNTSTPRDERTTYDVSAVYGGGNQADYIPTDATLVTDPAAPGYDAGNQAKVDAACAEVIIDGCDKTSIEYVYGGGNAAAVPATDVTILGSYIIHYVFGGGNGKSTATFVNPGANVGLYNNGASEYGSGKAVTKLVGCHAHYVFGGSNTKGNIRGGTSILMPDKSLYPAPDYDCCAVRDIREIYGAGNEAEQDGNVTMILGCVHNMKNVYGGARKANVKGGIDLVVTSGSFEGVFGGNDISGTIQGPITLTIEETGCDPLEIDNLYLGGNQAAYSIYGYKNTGTVDAPVLVARTKAEYDALSAAEKTAEGLPYDNPVLNVISCTRIGKTSGEDLGGAFGGGLGNGAVMYGDPTVNINMIPGDWATKIDANNDGTEDNDADALGTITNVYGGGKLANVEGNTAVNIGTLEKIAHRTNMGAEISEGNRVQKDVQPAIITGNVFGAGKGRAATATDVDSAFVTGNTTIIIEKATIAKSVFGGGELSQVGGNTDVTVMGGTIGTTGLGAAEYGNVYGAGLGSESGVGFGLVKGNTNITIQNKVADAAWVAAHPDAGKVEGDVLSTPTIYHNIYGGGALASVGTYTYNASNEITGHTDDTGKATIEITGGTIGTDGHNNGMVFGSSRGEIDDPASIHDKLAWVYDTEVTIGTNGAATGPTLHGSLYGGGENGHVYHDAIVTMYSGTVGNPSEYYSNRGNVYGAGCGTDKYYSTGEENHSGNGDKYNPIAGIVKGNATVIINGGDVANNVYGAGSMGKVEGNTSVTINTNGDVGVDGTHDDGNVYGAARGELDLTGKIPSGDDPHSYSSVTNSSVTITKGTVKGSVYGGGKAGVVNGAVTVNMTGGTVNYDVYGGGALAQTNTSEYVLVKRLTVGESSVKGYYTRSGSPGSYTYTAVTGESPKAAEDIDYYQKSVTTVSVSGGTITRNLYGGGLGDLASEGEGHSDVAADVNGPVTVTVSNNGKAANVFGCNNLNGSPKQTVAVNVTGTAAMESGSAISNVYGGGNLAAYTGDPTVTISGGTVNNVYGGGLGTTAVVTGNTSVTISGGTIGNDVYGGGSLADVTGSVDVSVSGGIITNDVYGGGALAQTNTANWDGDGSLEYVVVTGLVGETYRVKDDIVPGSSVTGLYTYDSGTSTYVAATGTAAVGTTYYEKLSGAPVAGYYTESGGVYTKLTTGTANGETTYYKKQIKGGWVTPAPINGTDYYTTTVSLTGGLIGNAYGGGLGRQESGTKGSEGYVAPVAANVYGDVTVTVNEGVSATSGVTFVQRIEHPIIDGVDYPTPTSGRVFGCNNHNGTPTGDVTVHVYATRQIDANNQIIAGHGSSDRKYTYEIQSVYGGGNQADYLPASTKKSQVIIEGCEDTSIEKVYGGGNSAVVPETNVTIYGAYDIGYAFGGGNGDKPIKKADGIWYENEGAIVIGMARVTCHGGKIGQVFGGGDAKGSCGNTNAVTAELESTDPQYCRLHITRLYGAGNKGDVSAVNIVLAACSGEAIEYVHGGSYNAHVAGDVHLTITSGILKNVYGGNDARGGIGGNIIVDIEETNGCNPIIIQNLVGGGNEAPYPGTYKNGSGVEVPYTTRGNITVNVKSATRIDNIYGGSFMAEANADAQVNINMIKGNKAGTIVEIPKEFSYIPNISNIENVDSKTIRCAINDSIGTIGNVFGGGNQGVVKGNTAVNISSSDKVSIMQRDGSGKIKVAEGGVIDAENGSNIEGKTILYDDDVVVLGAHITGSVYGGGNMADVTIDSTKVDDKWVKFGGNAEVNICAKESSTPGTYEAVAEGTDKVYIKGSVFGGGKGAADSFQCEKAMVGKDGDNTGAAYSDKGTNVRIGNGTICGSVYGGGEIGRVEFDTKVTIGFGDGASGNAKSPIIYGYVYGAGQGVATHGYSGLTRGNSYVTIQGDAKIGHSVYGAGKMASLGRYNIATTQELATANGVELGMPYGLKSGGHSTVTIQGYAEIGPNNMAMPTFDGNVFAGGKGDLPYADLGPEGAGRYYMKDGVYTWESYEGDAKEDAYIKYIRTLGINQSTDLTIGGHAFIKGSAYGGSENGYVRANTLVKIQDDCQIGIGQGKSERYTTAQWTGENASDFTECASWPYGLDTDADGKADLFAPYDKFAKTTGELEYPDGTSTGGGRFAATSGRTFFGNVFGGGCGQDPYKPGKWNPDAGVVGGNTVVNITGGHILTCIYGGNEMTDVKGKCTVNMVGGTLGVPRTVADMKAHPVTCYLFGGGKGDPRTIFNEWTNVSETEVNVTGTARIFGSTFGGAEDGHVIGNAVTNIGGTVQIDINGDGDTADEGETFTAQETLKIGTTGTSYVDGNVFGGGRGFTGISLRAGSIGGNTEINIGGGTMLGSVYGGGRLASVGVDFTKAQSADSGQFSEDGGGNTYGYVTINISGGTIGNDDPAEVALVAANGHTKGGNVFGGSMGRLTLLDDTPNTLWSKLAQVKASYINITGGTIKSNVYGGAEYGTTRDSTNVTIGGTRDKLTGVVTPSGSPTINGCVYGSGYGSLIDAPAYNSDIVAGDAPNTVTYRFTPMQYAGIVGGETVVNVVGNAHVLRNVYGGGEMASVGVIDYSVDGSGNYLKAIKHNITEDGTVNGKTFYDFGLSWPYEFEYVPTLKDGESSYRAGGKTTVNITGTAHVDHYVYGGGKGRVWFGATQATEEDITEQRYREAHIANVRETHVTIGTLGGDASLTTPTIGPGSATASASVYGGGEDGHVIGDANVTIHHGTIGHSVFGGGKGLGQYTTTLWDPNNATEGQNKASSELAYSWTAGRVYGNTNVTMYGGKVGWFIYGGGNLGSVGKGSYSGGKDDYSTGGYGELPSVNGIIWTSSFNPAVAISESNKPDNAYYFLSSGIATVNLLGGEVGTTNGGNVGGESYDSYRTDGVPYGSVFGGSRGRAAASCRRSPRYRYVPDFFLGYTNKAIVNIGGTSKTDLGDGPTIHGSVYGGGQDGHVRNNTEVHVYKGDIAGQDPLKDTAGRTGNVFGAGSGLGTYDTVDSSNNPIKAVNNSSGSVTCTTLVEVYGDNSDNPATATTKIAGSVYGGGALASVGPPRTGQPADEQKAPSDAHASYSYTQVDIKGGRIGGSVYGACRGPGNAYLETVPKPIFDTTNGEYDPAKYATNIWSYLNVTGGTILDNAYGGGEGGLVKQDTEVSLTGGKITNDAYGGGKGTKYVPADVMGNATLELNKGVANDEKGCVVKKVFGCNDFRGTPKGHVKVHVFATQNRATANISTKVGPGSYASLQQGNSEGYIDYLNRLIALSKVGGVVKPGITASVITAAETTVSGKVEGSLTDEDKTAITNAAKNVLAELEKTPDYDVQAVYGGGDLAMYEPDNKDESTEVIIEGCDVTSIKQVYGGGNAAPVSGTNLLVKSCYVIDEVFGGGNGKDNYQLDGKWYENPGANVGYKQLSHYVTDAAPAEVATYGDGQEATPYKAIVNKTADGYDDATTPEGRRANYEYGNGVAITTINGGHIHAVYGCSNAKGNIRAEARSTYQQIGTCTMAMNKTYGGSKESDTDGLITVEMECVDNGDSPTSYFGGSYKANIYSDINIHITNGSYDQIFGGNDRAGTINGKITITVEEYGCTPIRINELYAGGNLAPYSVYGFKTETQNAKDADGNDLHEDNDPSKPIVQQRIPYRAGEIGALTTPHWDPRINIISASWIGKIFGGGYGAYATVIGNPHVNVNMTEGKILSKYNDYKPEYATLYPTYDGTGDDKNRVIPIGRIGTIYGGGNLASVEGDTYVEIGTGQWIASWDAQGNPVWESTNASGDKYSYKEKTAAVYYSQAECDTYNADPANHVIGYIASGTELTAEQVTKVKEALGTSYVAGAELTTKDANAYNATLSGARKTTDVESYYSEEDCNTYNATLAGAVTAGDDTPADYETKVGSPAAGTTLTAEEANAYNAKLTGAIKTTDVKSYYSQAECDAYNSANVSGYIAKHTKLDAAQATAVNTALTPNYVSGQTITEADRNAYNATLPNALKTTDVKTEAVWAWYDAYGDEVTTSLTLNPRNAANITGDVFGGGRGVAETSGETAFTCAKGMVGVDGDGIDYPEGGTSVTIGNGTVTIGGSVYGGGEVGRVEKNTSVTIGQGDGTGTTGYPAISKDVYGAGKGVETHGYSALVRGNSTVTIQGDTKVGGSVYGGGKIASIGRYNVVDGRPTSLKNPNSGNCVVIVRGYAEIGPDNMTMTKVGGPDNTGHVFGAGQGAMPGIYTYADNAHKPWNITKTGPADTGTKVWSATEKDYLDYIETLALATHTDVTIGGHAFVKGDVFGGAEQGFVQHDTHVTIEGDCQIGNGYAQMDDDGKYLDELTTPVSHVSINRRYSDDEWAAGHLITVDSDPEALKTLAATYYKNSLPECASWKYKSPHNSHDIYANESGYDAKGGDVIATNGHTFFGIVFGGGSGYFPYKAGTWHWKAGEVGGNAVVDIKGGHILTNVYGGNEMTSVDGKCTVNMSGGTIGVPRTLGQIINHPVTCYLFGGGMGDARSFFNQQTNVNEVEVKVTGGWVYGSVFGGAEDGHVKGNATVTISGAIPTSTTTFAELMAGSATKIGTFGTSYVDGNIFGGGRGFDGLNTLAGRIGGNATVNVSGGRMLGSVYGGGRLGSVGIGDTVDGEGRATILSGDDHGVITVNITGGTIGNDEEFQYVDNTNYSTLTAANGALRNTEFDDEALFKVKTKDEADATDPTLGLITEAADKTPIYRLSHTKGGNVFAGCMGRLTTLNNTINSNWGRLAWAEKTVLTISEPNSEVKTTIMGNVYGGAEFGALGDPTDKPGATTTININGGTIGTAIMKNDVPQYYFGSVYGGGYGCLDEVGSGITDPKDRAGLVHGCTVINMTAGTVLGSVYGGGEVAPTDSSATITISGGEVGVNKVRKDDGYVMYGSYRMGNVFGAGMGSKEYPKAGIVKGNTDITISGGTIYHNIYGGGALASVGDFKLSKFNTTTNKWEPEYIPAEGIPYGWDTEADGVTPNGNSTGTATITITGGTIGISGRDNGMVNGSARGDIAQPVGVKFTAEEIDAATEGDRAYGKTTDDWKIAPIDPYDKVAWVKNSYVNIGTENAGTYATPLITGNVYGGGENGHNSVDSYVNIYSGTVGVVSGTWATIGDDANTRVVNGSRGAVYGAGCGQDTYTITKDGKKFEYYNPKSGMVAGNSYVTVKGGLIARNVYGGGSIASLGVITNVADTATTAKHTSETTSFALSWPYKIEYQPGTGVANVNIEGGHIGMGSERIVGLDNGNVYGGSKGAAGDRYAMAHLANVKESHVTINFTPTSTNSNAMLGSANYAQNAIEGSVFGGGENGHVIGDTHVTLTNGFVSHSMFGGGRGEGRYMGQLVRLEHGPGATPPNFAPLTHADSTNVREIYDWLAGKVYGNTHLTIVDGRILNNVLGGGYMASVGVGNYASGTDDFYPTGYGEKIDDPLWTSSSTGDNAWWFLNSGKTYVNVFGGEIGSTALWDDLPAGSVFGGCRGMAAPNLRESSRYLYNPEWLSGYTNETHVTIGGGYECVDACTDKNSKDHVAGEIMSLQELQEMFAGTTGILAADGTPVAAYWKPITGDGPKIRGSVYGGAQDGRVRRDAHVVVNAGEIGYAYNETNQTKLETDDLDSKQWLHRGNVYGGGSGLSKYKFDINCDGDTDDKGLDYYDAKINEEDYCPFAGSVIRYTQVDINGGTIHRNVYGGGSLGSVGPPAVPPTRTETAYKVGTTTRDAANGGGTIGQGWWSRCTVNIRGNVGTPTDYQNVYGGEVYGASRGVKELDGVPMDPDSYGNVVWTVVNILKGAKVLGNVFGGGDAGMVKRNSEVNVGDLTPPTD